MQPVCDQLALRVHQHVSQGYWERFATSVLPLKTIKQYATEAVRIAVKGM